jgi:hypothetical protein
VIIGGSKGEGGGVKGGISGRAIPASSRAHGVGSRAESKVNDLRDRALVTFVKKLDPLTRFIPRVTLTRHSHERGRIARVFVTARSRYEDVGARCEQLPQFIPPFCSTESFLAFLTGVPLLPLNVAFKCTYGLVAQLHFDRSMKPPGRHFYCRGLVAMRPRPINVLFLQLRLRGNAMRANDSQRIDPDRECVRAL